MQAVQPDQSVRSAEAIVAGRACGAMLFSFFGAILLEIWNRRSGAGQAVFIGIALLGISLILAAYLRYRKHAPVLAAESASPERKRGDRIFHAVNTGQWLLIVVLGNVLANIGLGAWVVPMAITVVGFALVYPQFAAGGPADPMGFLGSGLILWLSAGWALRKKSRAGQ